MPDPVTTNLVIGAGSSLLATDAGQDAIDNAKSEEERSALLAAQVKREMFDKAKELQANYAAVGKPSLSLMSSLSGLNGEPARLNAESQMENSPEFQGILKGIQEGTAGITGRTGDVSGAVVDRLSPALLEAFITNKYAQNQGLAGLGKDTSLGMGGAALNAGIDGINTQASLSGTNAAAEALNDQLNTKNLGTASKVLGQLSARKQMSNLISSNPNLF